MKNLVFKQEGTIKKIYLVNTDKELNVTDYEYLMELDFKKASQRKIYTSFCNSNSTTDQYETEMNINEIKNLKSIMKEGKENVN